MKKLFIGSTILAFAIILQIALYFETEFYHIEIIWIIILGLSALEVPLLSSFILIQFFKGWRIGKHLDDICSSSAKALLSICLIITAISLFVLIDAEEPYFGMTEWGTSVVVATLIIQFWCFNLFTRLFQQWKLTKKLEDLAYLISIVQVNHLLIMVTAYYFSDICKFRALLNLDTDKPIHFTECIRTIF